MNLDGIKLEDEMRQGSKQESLFRTLKSITNLRGTNKTLDKDLRGGIATTTNLRGTQYDVMPTHSNSNGDISI